MIHRSRYMRSVQVILCPNIFESGWVKTTQPPTAQETDQLIRPLHSQLDGLCDQVLDPIYLALNHGTKRLMRKLIS